MKMNKKGFTLIEMLVVIAIIAVLVSIVIPVVGSSTTKAAAATDAANLRSAKASLTIMVLDGTIDKAPENANGPVAITFGTAAGEIDFDVPVAKSSDGGEFAATVDKFGNIEVNFGTNKTIEHYAAIAGGEPETT